jgi:DNA polymerase I
MQFDLHTSVTLSSGTFSALVAPEELVLAGLNDNPVLKRFLFLFICGNYSRLLSGINRRSVSIEVRRAFTAFQLLTILRESYHTIIFVEHDPTLYEGSGEEVAGQVAEALKSAGQGSAVVLYAPEEDQTFSDMARLADRFFSLSSPPVPPLPRARRAGKVRHPATLARSQTTLEGF